MAGSKLMGWSAGVELKCMSRLSLAAYYRRFLGLALTALLVGCGAGAWIASYDAPPASAATSHAAARLRRHAHHRSASRHSLRRSAAKAHAARKLSSAAMTVGMGSGPLRFGIYPWGAVGASSSVAPSVPENATASMAAVQRLRGGHRFVVHLYADYTGTSTASADALMSEATWWSSNGLRVAAVLRYRPADATMAAGYLPWVRTQTRRLAAIAGTTSIQIANEPNNLSPGSGDGSYPGVIAAIAGGVPVARSELITDGRPDVLVGFNWAAGSSPTTTEPMWTQLRRAGGTSFAAAVGFVSVDVYPGTWSPPSASAVPTSAQISATMTSTLKALRATDMPDAGVGGAAIVIGETGYPTMAGRTEATQNAVLESIVSTVDSIKATYGVTDLYWYSLRDANTASDQLENGYGLLRDDYSAKPAFATLQQLIATVGA